ncbi:hypothetical protein HK096_010160 [Nowakowskiella sp. JEL0078]|nr:hypothetical protein HK096_010160 [Nowakowskiella sp. JEL0078]
MENTQNFSTESRLNQAIVDLHWLIGFQDEAERNRRLLNFRERECIELKKQNSLTESQLNQTALDLHWLIGFQDEAERNRRLLNIRERECTELKNLVRERESRLSQLTSDHHLLLSYHPRLVDQFYEKRLLKLLTEIENVLLKRHDDSDEMKKLRSVVSKLMSDFQRAQSTAVSLGLSSTRANPFEDIGELLQIRETQLNQTIADFHLLQSEISTLNVENNSKFAQKQSEIDQTYIDNQLIFSYWVEAQHLLRECKQNGGKDDNLEQLLAVRESQLAQITLDQHLLFSYESEVITLHLNEEEEHQKALNTLQQRLAQMTLDNHLLQSYHGEMYVLRAETSEQSIELEARFQEIDVLRKQLEQQFSADNALVLSYLGDIEKLKLELELSNKDVSRLELERKKSILDRAPPSEAPDTSVMQRSVYESKIKLLFGELTTQREAYEKMVVDHHKEVQNFERKIFFLESTIKENEVTIAEQKISQQKLIQQNENAVKNQITSPKTSEPTNSKFAPKSPTAPTPMQKKRISAIELTSTFVTPIITDIQSVKTKNTTNSNNANSKNNDTLENRIASVVSDVPLSLPAVPTLISSSPAKIDKKYKRRSKKKSNHTELVNTAVTLRKWAKKIGTTNLVWDVPPRTVLIVTKFWDSELVSLTRVVALLLIQMGMTVLVEDRLKSIPVFEYENFFSDSDEEPSSSSTLLSSKSISESPEPASAGSSSNLLKFWNSDVCEAMSTKSIGSPDFIITLGGDGTVLFSAWMFQKEVPPIIPFHLGSLGFLGVFDFSMFNQSIKRILESDNIRMNFRMRFACTIHRKNKFDPRTPTVPQTPVTGFGEGSEENDHRKTFNILNDLVVDRGPSPYMSQLELYGNDKHLTTVQADGLVVGTPTGSTAYSLSAGGSVLHPDVSAFLITPICPHTLSFRPMILPDTMELRIMIPDDSRATAWASFDGRKRVQLRQGDSISIVASNYPVPTVCLDDQSTDWFQGLERCLGWNRRERQKALVE